MQATYYQCKMEKHSKDKILVQTAWIPEDAAKIGNYLSLRGAEKIWEDGWVVVEVGYVSASWDEVRERGRDYLKQREASDV